jgi:hypothetical protein
MLLKTDRIFILPRHSGYFLQYPRLYRSSVRSNHTHVGEIGFSVCGWLSYKNVNQFILRRVPQQKLRTHRSLKAYCATLVMKMKMRKMISFSFFPSNGAPVEWNWQGKTPVLGEKPVPVPLCPPQIPHGLARDRTRASAVGGRRLTAWTMARPTSFTINDVNIFLYS